jgi:hypothetical protein
LAREIMPRDAEVFGNQFPAYREDPMAVTLQAIKDLGTDPSYARRFNEFRRLMVYGDKIEYETCISTIVALAEKLREA